MCRSNRMPFRGPARLHLSSLAPLSAISGAGRTCLSVLLSVPRARRSLASLFSLTLRAPAFSGDRDGGRGFSWRVEQGGELIRNRRTDSAARIGTDAGAKISVVARSDVGEAGLVQPKLRRVRSPSLRPKAANKPGIERRHGARAPERHLPGRGRRCCSRCKGRRWQKRLGPCVLARAARLPATSGIGGTIVEKPPPVPSPLGLPGSLFHTVSTRMRVMWLRRAAAADDERTMRMADRRWPGWARRRRNRCRLRRRIRSCRPWSPPAPLCSVAGVVCPRRFARRLPIGLVGAPGDRADVTAVGRGRSDRRAPSRPSRSPSTQ